MSHVRLIELVGGAEDGRTFEVPEETIRARYIILPRIPDPPPDPFSDDDSVTFTRMKWEWDGTRTITGAYRFREVPL